MFAIRKCQNLSRYSNFSRGALGEMEDVFRSFRVLEWFQLAKINRIRRRHVAVFVVSCLLQLESVEQSPCVSHYSNHFPCCSHRGGCLWEVRVNRVCLFRY